MYINKFDRNAECAKRGREAELLFEDWLINNNREYKYAGTKDGQFDHIDYYVKNPITDEVISIDVKASKSINRGESANNRIIYVEFKNTEGRAGWLYGKEDYVAFHHPSLSKLPYSKFYNSAYKNFFIIVKTDEFAKFCENLCSDKNVFNSTNKKELYKRYSRRDYGRHDEFAMIKVEDIYDWGNYWELAV